MERRITVFLLFVAFSSQFIARMILRVDALSQYFEYAVTLPIIIMLCPLLFKRKFRRLRDKFEFILILLLVPYAFAVMYTAFLVCLQRQTPAFALLSGSKMAVLMSYRLLLGSVLVFRFREKVIDIFAEALILSYMLNILNAAATIGVRGIVQYLTTMNTVIQTGYNLYFEMHDLGLSVGFLIMYQLLSLIHI